MKLGKIYSPADFEPEIYELWEASKAFTPSGKGMPFSVIMPPPNANAGLHIGHALNYNIIDIIARYKRMNGFDVLQLPGADHAGFETQVVYEKHLAKEGKSRFDFTREELYDRVWDFVQENKSGFERQLRAFGVSCDWSRFTFTLEDKVVETAYSTFKRLWDDGLIYRGERLVNYCTQHRTGFADIEVVHEDATTPLYYMKYGPFELATTRPETKFGDTAVAVHPDDERYAEYVGQTIEVEGVNGPFEIRVVADEMVDRQFGTGVVKITPAHDPNDWEVAQRHNLEAVRVINHDGTMNHRAGRFEGMPLREARKAVAEALKEKGLLLKVDEKYQNRVGKCYKCGTVIEPMLMDQWFIRMDELAKPAIKALEDKKVTFYPSQKREQMIQYLQNVRDWNISRQIAWGIPIPAFQNVDDPDEWIFNDQVSEHTVEIDGKTYRRDPDVFDTWFSSGQWPYVTLDHPDGDDFKRYYPNSLMEMGTDIMFQWGARMLALGLYTTGEIPFNDLYLHGMVRAEDGRKMSKSIGNVVSPIEVMDEYGADALRMGIVAGRSAGDSAAWAPAKIIAGRNYCNKLWNMARYVEGVIEGEDTSSTKPQTAVDHWMLSKLQHTTKKLQSLLEQYRISEAYDVMYHFVWDDVADWYLEASKVQKNPGMLLHALKACLRLSHPFAPFATEAIWQSLELGADSLLIHEQWDTSVKYDKKRVTEFEDVREIVSETRGLVSALKLRKTHLYYSNVPFLAEQANAITALTRIEGVQEVESGTGLQLTDTKYDCWLDIDHESIKRHGAELQKQIDQAQKVKAGFEARLANENYTKKAPKALVGETRQQLADAEAKISKLQEELKRFS